MSIPGTFRAFRIHNDDAGYRAGIEQVGIDALAPGEVVLRTAFSSVKDREPFVIGSGFLSDEYAVEVSSKHQIDWFAIGETIFDIEEAYNSGEH